MLRRREDMPTFCGYCKDMAQTWAAGTNMARPHCMELRGAENSTLGSVYSILVQISMRETTMIGRHCFMQHSMDMRSLLECYLNVGQRLKYGVFSAPLHCTRRYEGEKSKPCD